MYCKRLFCALALCFPLLVMAQDDQKINLKNLAPPSSPAFVLMDVTPSNIIVPQNIQAFSLQTISAFTGDSSDGMSSNNYAFEFQPYWYAKRTDMNFFKYNNLTSDKDIAAGSNPAVDDYNGYNVFGNAWKNLSVSGGFLNGTFEVFNAPQSFISVGARTRLLTFANYKHISAIKDSYKAYENFMSSAAVISLMGQGLSLDELNKKLVALPGWKQVFDDMNNAVNKKPIFALDVALAYSHFLGDKSQNIDNGFGRFGIWASGDLAFNLPKINPNSYVHVYGVYRYLRDGLNMNMMTNELFAENTSEYGGKLEFEIKSLSFGYEYISRDVNDEYRSIGTIRYKINESLTLNSGFGKNYKSDSNTIALLGLQWGLDYKSAIDPAK
ncbi:hypothetical protein [Psychroserpens sp.]|uniref:hypothetical protein n=1 Tax=Psychroserpens sp. TaxID=2020870 RepID=UPI001B17C4BF|nr:hypothetical protein [Psychroserpens sp.]MBO6606415.1 hypothetical protein [Psychroserpens sp.]MBO6631223.1 hypothetical protein [Psychroserpens sp.]MBO6653119.1 hypothetical protein [Psychroserpens sp.]MBO6680853.1 hypothetical protein [Psychroserpens sp.]MBO6750189.1 hypothetical protein [Psychroserpens sp.]